MRAERRRDIETILGNGVLIIDAVVLAIVAKGSIEVNDVG
jgi:hypothetical protein